MDSSTALPCAAVVKDGKVIVVSRGSTVVSMSLARIEACVDHCRSTTGANAWGRATRVDYVRSKQVN